MTVVEMYNKCVDPIWGGCLTTTNPRSSEVERAGKKLNENKWLAKIVLGGKMPKYDKMDEKAKMCGRHARRRWPERGVLPHGGAQGDDVEL